MSRIDQTTLGLLAGLASLLPMGCQTSVCEEQRDSHPDCKQEVLASCASQRNELQSLAPFSVAVPGLKLGASVQITKLLLLDQEFQTPGPDVVRLEASEQGSLKLTLQPSQLSLLAHGGPVEFEAVIGNYWRISTSTQGSCRLFVPPVFSAAPVATFTYPSPGTLNPVAVEISQLAGALLPAAFVSENKNATRQLSRYDLTGPSPSFQLKQDPAFNLIVNSDPLAVLTLTESAAVTSPLVYDLVGGLAAFPLPMANRIRPSSADIPGGSIDPVVGMRGIPRTRNFFMAGGMPSANTTVQSFHFDGAFHRATRSVPLPNVKRLSARSLDAFPLVAADAARAFDAIALDDQNQVRLLRHAAPNPQTDAADLVSSQRATEAVSSALGGAPAVGVALADLDSDGLQDVIVTSSAGTMLWAAQNEDGSFQVATSVGISGLTNVRDIAVGDLDGDGRHDIIVATNDSLRVYRNGTP